MMIKRFFCFLFVFVGIASNVFAVNVNKTKFVINVGSGETYRDSLDITNDSNESITLRLYVEDFLYTAPYLSDKQILPLYSSEFTLGEMISFQPKQVVIEPQSTATVNFTIKAPDDFKKMACGLLFNEMTMGVGFDDTGKSFSMLSRIGTLIFVHPKEGKNAAEVFEVSGQNNSLIAKLKNSGDHFFASSGTYYILDANGMVVTRDELKEYYLLPGNIADMKIDLADTMAAGDYFMVLTVNAGDKDIVVREIEFTLTSAKNVKINSVN